MKKNKTVAFILAASLMVGGTFLGTKAWFTDEASASNELVVTMGTFDLKLDDSGWTKHSNQKESIESPEQNGNIYTNVRPGDWFEREYTLTNEGSLDQKIKVEGLIKSADEKNYKVEVINSDGNFATDTVLKGKDKSLLGGDVNSTTLKIKVTPNEEFYKGSSEDAKEVLKLDGKLEISAEQVNAK